jgi:hypothetical protein
MTRELVHLHTRVITFNFFIETSQENPKTHKCTPSKSMNLFERDCKAKVGLAKDKGSGYTSVESMYTVEINEPATKEIVLD